MLAGFGMSVDDNSAFDQLQMALGGVAGYPYSGSPAPDVGIFSGLWGVISQAVFGQNATTQIALQTLQSALSQTWGFRRS